MKTKDQTPHVRCPKCGTKIDVNDVLYHQLKSEFDRQYSDLKKEKNEIEKMRLKIKTSIDKEVNQKISLEKIKIERRLKENFEAEAKYKLKQELDKEKSRIQKEAENKSLLKIAEKEHVITQLKKQLLIASRQADQGSMQTQGEVMEIELEKSLKAAYPFDDISEIAKGVNGADLLFTVHNINNQACGIIAIESKRTKTFSNSWVDKLKDDQRRHKADCAILITETMPKNMTQFGFKGVWICSYQEASALIFILRETLIKIHEVKSSDDNRKEKVDLLYSYLASNEFSHQIQAIVEGLTKLKSNLEQEKRALFKVWKDRERSIDSVAATAVEMYSSIKNIAGSSVKSIKVLDLPLLENGTSKKS
jgi:hypothetical protein